MRCSCASGWEGRGRLTHPGGHGADGGQVDAHSVDDEGELRPADAQGVRGGLEGGADDEDGGVVVEEYHGRQAPGAEQACESEQHHVVIPVQNEVQSQPDQGSNMW